MNNLRWLEINLNNLKSNICNLKSIISPKTRFMAVVKSNAYGHGIVECSKAAVEAGADWLGVVNTSEAIKLRKSEVAPPIVNFKIDESVKNRRSHLRQLPILVLGYVEPKDFELAAKNNISVAVVNWEQLNKLKTQNSKLKIHLKIETGISRLGFVENEWSKLIEEITKLPKNVIVEGIYSHFASVEEYDLAYAKKQIDKFKKFKELFDSNYTPYPLNLKPVYHMAASAATMILPESHFDMVRCGIAIYGLWPSRETRDKFESKKLKVKSEFLKPVLSFKTKIAQIKEVKRGDYIGYGCTYPVDKPMTIAIIPVGYAEGFNRGFSNPALAGNKSGEALVSGRKCSIVGRVCMNMSVVDITNLKISNSKLKIDDEVILLGHQGSEKITADEWAEKLGTINYEITTSFPEQIKRIYNSN